MISQSLYLVLCVSQSHELTIAYITENRMTKVVDELQQFIKPYVLVIHQPSGRGFYLDRQYRCIVDVSNCQEPENPTEVARHQLPGSGDLPAWVSDELDRTDNFNCYDTFWLY